MLTQWKIILNNWINCFNKQSSKHVDRDTLLSVLTQLNKNISLDESASSVLEANTLEEFLLEKYPHFKFENGSTTAITEHDIDTVASLLLFFICVNSKDVDIKKIMCNQLDTRDQETIMKYSKFLLDCPTITYRDVQDAILEACGQDSVSVVQRRAAAETPPAVRLMHTDVRRLQAALDAERFDRNYLQEELVRMQEKVDKLTQDKEQYKQDILDLRCKLEQSSDEAQGKATGATDSVKKTRKKLQRQVDDLEQRLYESRAFIDDLVQERTVYKKKVDELKAERDKWLLFGQEETSRSGQLADQLEAERSKVRALNEVLAELRQHNEQNKLDGSLLECDDADSSHLAANFNVSVSNEACVNVIEVQLAEERDKVNELQQRIQTLQAKIDEMTTKTEQEKQTNENIIKDKDEDIMNLKHRLNEHFEETNSLKTQLNDRIIELNNEVNELEQKLKSNNERYSNTIEEMQEIQARHQDKLALLQSYSDQITKLENINQNLKTILNTERSQKQNMMDDYENRIMKLNEKISNRNNELVDLQNSMCEKSEMIESLHLQIRTEKESNKELQNNITSVTKHKEDADAIILSLRKEISDLNQNLESEQSKFNELKKQIVELQTIIVNLESVGDKLNETLKEQNKTIEQLENEVSTLKTEKENHLKLIQQKNDLLVKLQEQLHSEISLKTKYETEAASINEIRIAQAEEIHTLRIDFDKQKDEINEKEKMITALDMYLNDEKCVTSHLNEDIRNLNEQLLDLKQALLEETQERKKERADKDKLIQENQNNKNVLNEQLEALKKEYSQKTAECESKNLELEKVNEYKENLMKKIEENTDVISTLELHLEDQKKKYKELEESFEYEVTKRITRISETERILKELRQKSNKNIEEKSIEIQKLKIEYENISSRLNTERQIVEVLEREKSLLIEKLEEEKRFRTRLEQEYQIVIINNSETTQKLEEEMIKKTKQIDELNAEIQTLQKEIHNMNQLLVEEKEQNEQKDSEITSLSSEIERLNNSIEQIQRDNEAMISENKAMLETIRKDNELLRFTIEETNLSHQATVKDKDKIIEYVASQAKESEGQQKSLQKLLEEVKLTSSRDIEHLSGLLNAKDVSILHLKEKIIELEDIIKEKCELIQKSTDKKTEIMYERDQLAKQLEIERQNVEKVRSEIENLQQQCVAEKSVKDAFETEKEQLKVENEQSKVEFKALLNEKQALLNEKEILTQQLVEEKAAKDISENEKSTLIQEKDELNKRITNILISKDKIETEKETLTYEINNLQTELSERKDKIEQMESEKQELISKLHELSDNLTEVTEDNKQLQHQIQDQMSLHNVLMNEKEIIMIEKDSIVKSLSEEKALRDLIQNEKNENLKKIQELIEEHSLDIKAKTQEFKKMSDELRQLQNTYDEKHSAIKLINFTVSNGLERILDSLKREDIQNELLQKLISTDIEEHGKPTQQCELLVNIADTLTTELSLRKKLEKALEHENLATNEMRQLFKQKDMQVHELQLENRSLQQNLADAKAELLKLNETYNDTIEEKHRMSQKLQQENQLLQNELNDVKIQLDLKVHSLKEKLIDNENLTEKLKKSYEGQIENLNVMMNKLSNYLKDKNAEYDAIRKEKDKLQRVFEEKESVIKTISDELKSLKNQQERLMSDFEAERLVLKNMVTVTESVMTDQKSAYEKTIQEYTRTNQALTEENNTLKQTVENEIKNSEIMLKEKEGTFDAVFKQMADERNAKDVKLKECYGEISDLKEKIEVHLSQVECQERENKLLKDEVAKLQNDIGNLEHLLKHEIERNKQLVNDNSEVSSVTSKYAHEIRGKNAEIDGLQNKLHEVAEYQEMLEQKDSIISTLTKELREEKSLKDKYQTELEKKTTLLYEYRQQVEELSNDRRLITKQYDDVKKIIQQREIRGGSSQDVYPQRFKLQLQEALDHQHQVDISPTESQHSSDDSYKTISDLERIISDKNRTITTLQTEITYLKTLVAESENKRLDVANELEHKEEQAQQLATQLKKIVQQKNDEINDLKKQYSKVSASENRASEIIKVSAKHQAMILKCIAEIKSNNVLKELTNFANQNVNLETEIRRSLAGNITTEDLENYLETTEIQLKKSAEKQLVLQKERDRLIEVNKINETELINMKNFLNQLSLSYRTFSLVKDVYAQQLSRIVTLQRAVRRDILNLDGYLDDASLCKLERAYTAAMQDLAECAMNIERWVERSLGRTISAEKIKQAFTSDLERHSLATCSYQNASIEVQLEEMESTFKKLQDEVSNSQKKGPQPPRDTQSVTVNEVRAEYEDKLNRMKAKMKQLYQEQVTIFKEKQKEEFGNMQKQLKDLSNKLEDSSRTNDEQKCAYEEHIRKLTSELWTLGERYLMKSNEAEWLQKKLRTPSLMSLQHVYSSGIGPNPEDRPRPSDTTSLRSYPRDRRDTHKKSGGRALHMSDEEGEVFDNRWLHELDSPRRSPDPRRVSELRWRNSLCPPHLKSSYPTEHVPQGVDEEHIKFMSEGNSTMSNKAARKEVGITAYKKPGPPTPGKQAGRLSATSSDLRESIRFDPESSAAPKKTSTPSRIRALFRSSKDDGTPRKRLSIFKRNK